MQLRLSNNTYTDTSSLLFTNKAGVSGTEIKLSSVRENGLFFSSNSDLAGNTRDNILVIKPNGRVGVGLDPLNAEVFSVSGRMRLFSGSDLSSTSGVWLNQVSNIGDGAFMGMENNQYVGFFGASGAGWDFCMSTSTGALKINGSTGSAGQVLTSNGGSAPVWKSITPYASTKVVASQEDGTWFAPDNARYDVPGLSITFSIAATSKVVVSAMSQLYTESCAFGCSEAQVFIYLLRTDVDADGSLGRTNYRTTVSYIGSSLAFPAFAETLAAGTYTYKLQIDKINGSKIGMGTPGIRSQDTNNNYITIQTFPL